MSEPDIKVKTDVSKDPLGAERRIMFKISEWDVLEDIAPRVLVERVMKKAVDIIAEEVIEKHRDEIVSNIDMATISQLIQTKVIANLAERIGGKQ